MKGPGEVHPAPDRVEGPDEALPFINGIFALGPFQVRALVVPPGSPNPGEGLPHFVVRMTQGHHLVVISEGPTRSAMEWEATMRATAVEFGRDPGKCDWRIHEENVFGTRRPDA